ncbi:MAG: DUF4173 domain-containing protein [Anaerolineaceae bacterium]|nr:MAG: DUF4173 domain-containing protein [Anaerolineaceae bacterium]
MEETLNKHNHIRNNFGLYGGLSLIFGIIATLLFYKAGIGLNSFIFTITMVIILVIVSKKLKIGVSKGSSLCFLGAILLGISNVLTSSGSLQFLNSIGILLLLEVSLIRLFYAEKAISLIEYLFIILILPIKALSSIGMLFVDSNRYVKDKNLIKNEKIRNIFIGCLIAIPLMVVSIALLSSADIIFGKITWSIFEWIFYRDFYIIVLMIFIGTLLCYSLLCGATKESSVKVQNKSKANSTIGITVSTLLLSVYILFCGIQVLYLFSGGLFQLPAEFTYAEYARRGFFELLAVTCFNIILILICVNVFEENKWLNAILTAITASTYIMIASATYRMLLYIGAYHLTFLRLFVLLFLLIDALLLAGVIISMYHKKFPLFEYSVIVISVCYLLFSFSKPDYHIAKYFVAHNENITNEDIPFLTIELSYDAASVVVPFLNEQYEYDIYTYIDKYYDRVEARANTRDIRDYNFSYQKAFNLMK